MRVTEYWVLPFLTDYTVPLSKHTTHRQAEREARRIERTTGCKPLLILRVHPMHRLPAKGRP